MKTSQNSNTFSPAALEQYQEANGGCACAATINFNADDILRLQRLYATVREAYYGVQMVDTEGCIRITVESLTHTATLSGADIDLFNALVEPLIAKLTGLEKQIVAMTAGLQAANEYSGGGHRPETDAILALCLPPTTPAAATPERCPLLPELATATA